MQPIAILHEHPEWFKPLFAEFDRRGVPYFPLHAADHAYDPDERDVPYSLVVNRMSPSAWMRGHREAIFHTLRYLEHLDDLGAPVLNGATAFRYELSKAAQYSLMARLGIGHPATRVLSQPEQALAAADGLRYPVLVKPNIGGSGAGIRSFATPEELATAVEAGSLDFGIDHVGLLQEHVPAEGEAIVRIEVLDGRFLYAIRLLLTPGTFNLCPADYCELPGMADGVSAAACRSRRTTHRRSWSNRRAGWSRPPAWTSAASSTSSALGTGSRTSTTSMRCRTSWPMRRTSSASTRTSTLPT